MFGVTFILQYWVIHRFFPWNWKSQFSLFFSERRCSERTTWYRSGDCCWYSLFCWKSSIWLRYWILSICCLSVGDHNVGKSTTLYTFVEGDFPIDTVLPFFDRLEYVLSFAFSSCLKNLPILHNVIFLLWKQKSQYDTHFSMTSHYSFTVWFRREPITLRLWEYSEDMSGSILKRLDILLHKISFRSHVNCFSKTWCHCDNVWYYWSFNSQECFLLLVYFSLKWLFVRSYELLFLQLISITSNLTYSSIISSGCQFFVTNILQHQCCWLEVKLIVILTPQYLKILKKKSD